MVSECESPRRILATDGYFIVDDGELFYLCIRLLDLNNNIRVDNHLNF
jgi:hypothetical protein